jgi:hypothetical protein
MAPTDLHQLRCSSCLELNGAVLSILYRAGLANLRRQLRHVHGGHVDWGTGLRKNHP